jgi:hypothetical protein
LVAGKNETSYRLVIDKGSGQEEITVLIVHSVEAFVLDSLCKICDYRVT